MRAVLSGGFWAIVLGGGALAVASVVTDQPSGITLPLPPQTEIAATAEIAPLPESPAAVAPAPVVEAPVVAPRVAEPAPAPLAPPPDVAAMPPAMTITLDDELQAPAVMADTQVTLAPDMPVLPSAVMAAPALPAQDRLTAIPTRPAEPAPVAPSPADVELAGVQDSAADTAPVATLPQIAPAPPLPEPQIANPPEPLEVAPSGLPPSAAGVRVNRPGVAPATPVTPSALPEDADATALVRYAADFDYAADLPMLAIVLLDNAMILDAPEVLSGLPFVPTIVLNASSPDVTARMQAYRAAGIEVLLQADLPEGALPSDVETTYAAAFALVPEAIAVFSDGTGPEAGNSGLAEQIMRLTADDGRGFVSVPRGLGGSLRNAASDGVPSVTVARELDAAGESRDAIERSLQQAALRARQSGHAVLLGRTTPDTLAAIRSWANRSDPSQLSLAPVSAILMAQITD
jgi:hypothetical protein